MRGASLTSRGSAWSIARTAAACFVAWLAWVGDARADEPRLSSEPPVMREPGEVVDVVDAFDDRDPFDIHIGLGFGFVARRATITEHGKGHRRFGETITRLVPRVEAGLYKDLALTATLPILLADARSITSSDRTEGALASSNGQTLALLPFNAPDRSGPEYLGLGAEWGPLNQARNPKWPTLMFGAAVRLPIGDTMRGCTDAPHEGQIRCAHPADLNRDGKRQAGEPAAVTETRVAGTTRGTVGFELYANVSRRIRYVEPYLGLRALVEIPVGTGELAQASGAEPPPVELGGSIGTLFIPWENRERFARVTFDVRVDASVRTAGTDYSELFDVLGSSGYPDLRAASVSGVTHVAAYPLGNLGANAIWQSSRFVKLAFGLGVGYAANHDLAGRGKSPTTAPPAVTGAEMAVRDNLSVGVVARGVVMF